VALLSGLVFGLALRHNRRAPISKTHSKKAHAALPR
jgi:hypothetical protein